jgi:hypothetical protein
MVVVAGSVLFGTALSASAQATAVPSSMLFNTGGETSGTTGSADGSGFSDYVNGLPTKITLPGGKVLDLSIPENTVAEQGMSITSFPTVPRPLGNVTLTLDDYATNLEEDRITWSINGKIVSDQIGGNTITVRMGPAGTPYMVRVVVDSLSAGKRLAKDFTLNPADVAILWEADTYTPPFYRGKALPSYLSIIKLTPLPMVIGVGGKRVSPDQLIYSWKQDYVPVQSISGYGKTSAEVAMGTGVQETVLTLDVKDATSQATAERTVTISAVDPKLLFYAGTPLQGIQYGRALGESVAQKTQEMTIDAEPYFFANTELGTSDAALKWQQNGVSITGSGLRTITLRVPGNVSGSSRIDASLANNVRILESASRSLVVNYGGTQ